MDQDKYFPSENCDILSHAVSTDGNVDTDSGLPCTEDVDGNTALLSLASDYNLTEDSDTLPGNTDNGSISYTWADGVQVCCVFSHIVRRLILTLCHSLFWSLRCLPL